MVNMMKALVFTAPHTFEYRDVPRPEPAPDEVLVEVKACAICGSDVHGSSGENGRRIPPLVMGHEASGTIAQLGEAVQGWAVGDRVTFLSNIIQSGADMDDEIATAQDTVEFNMGG